MNLGGLLKDKRVLIAGGAVALGVGVLVARRRGSSGGTPTQATLDTSASDMAQALGSAEASWAADLREFTGTLQSVQSQLNKLPPAGVGNPTPNPAPAPAPASRPTVTQAPAQPSGIGATAYGPAPTRPTLTNRLR